MSRSPTFLKGSNLPWISYGSDVGSHPHWGRCRDDTTIGLALARLGDAGCCPVRWFLLCDMRSEPRIESGQVIGFTGSALGEQSALLLPIHLRRMPRYGDVIFNSDSCVVISSRMIDDAIRHPQHPRGPAYKNSRRAQRTCAIRCAWRHHLKHK